MQRDPRTLAIVALGAAIIVFLGAGAFAVLGGRGTATPTPSPRPIQAQATPLGTPTRAAATPAARPASPAATPATPVVANASASPATPAGRPAATPGLETPRAATPTGSAPPFAGAPGLTATPTIPGGSVPPILAPTPTAPPVVVPPTAPPPVIPTATPPPAPTATPPPPPVAPLAIDPLRTDALQYGFNVFLAGNAEGAGANSQAMGKVRGAGFGWVRVQLQWQELEPAPGSYNTAPYDTIIAAAANGGANVLVSVVKAPAWAAPSRPGALPENTAAFQRTMAFLAARYSGRVQAWEIWNEQNLAGEVGGQVAVAPYVATLKAGYLGVKSANPGAFVLFGGLTPTGLNDPSVAVNDVEYLREFYEYAGGDGRNYFDALAAHPGSAANPPDTKYPDQPGPGTCPPKFAAQQGSCWRDAPDFYFRRIEDQRAVMERYGDGVKQVWLTEFGWDSCQGLPAPNGYEYCALISEGQQAQYLVRAIQIAQTEWPWLGALFVWNLNYAATPSIATSDEKYGWSVLRGDGSNRPAYDALKNLPK